MDKQPLNTGEQKDMTEFFTDLITKIEEMSQELVNTRRFTPVWTAATLYTMSIKVLFYNSLKIGVIFPNTTLCRNKKTLQCVSCWVSEERKTCWWDKNETKWIKKNSLFHVFNSINNCWIDWCVLFVFSHRKTQWRLCLEASSPTTSSLWWVWRDQCFLPSCFLLVCPSNSREPDMSRIRRGNVFKLETNVHDDSRMNGFRVWFPKFAVTSHQT